jgi:serine/threonine protein kinase
LSHRAISPTAVLVNGRQGALRDFGLATTPARPGENSSPHRAPEQRYGAVGQRPGPPTDVYLLGLLLYGAMTGRPPAFEPVPVPAGPETLSRATAGALRSDPAERPGISEFRGAVLDAARELAASPPSHR